MHNPFGGRRFTATRQGQTQTITGTVRWAEDNLAADVIVDGFESKGGKDYGLLTLRADEGWTIVFERQILPDKDYASVVISNLPNHAGPVFFVRGKGPYASWSQPFGLEAGTPYSKAVLQAMADESGGFELIWGGK